MPLILMTRQETADYIVSRGQDVLPAGRNLSRITSGPRKSSPEKSLAHGCRAVKSERYR